MQFLISENMKKALDIATETAAKYSSDSIKIIIYKDHFLFQPQKGPKDEL